MELARIGPYVLQEELARGGQGVVYRARHERLGSDVAVKVLLDPTPKARARFTREAQVVSQLSHPGLPRVIDLGESEGRPFLIMDFVRGEDLRQRVRRGGVPEFSWTARTLAAVARTVHYCHERGVIHRDLKPANIMIEEGSERALVIDFGLFKAAPEVGSLTLDQVARLSLTGEIRGSHEFMAPEQAGGERGAVGPCSDVYALGATLFFLLTGSPPYEGATGYNVLVQLLRDDPPPSADERNPKVPPALAEVCRAAMAKRPSDRPPSAEAFAERLLAAVEAPASAPASVQPWALLAGVGALLLTAAVSVVGWELLRAPGVARVPSREIQPGPASPPAPSATGQERVETPPQPEAVPEALLRAAPTWFAELPVDRRPLLPLPDGLSFAEESGDYRNDADGSLLIYVPPGVFVMGRDGMGHNEGPSHEVELTRGYFIGKFEVTWAQYLRYCEAENAPVPREHAAANAYFRDHTAFKASPIMPVWNVSWSDAQGYVRWAGLRLPSEAEWEYAARGADGRVFPWGSEPVVTNASFGRGRVGRYYEPDLQDGFPRVAPVGSFPAGRSPFGAYDMAGNMWEWVQDRLASYLPGRQTDPVGPPTGSRYVCRGSSFANSLAECTVTRRSGNGPRYFNAATGFRVARSGRAPRQRGRGD